MELSKYEHAYAINDNTENGWVVTGQVFKEATGQLSVNMTASLEGNHLGSYTYALKDNRLNVNVNIVKDHEDEFMQYSKAVLEDILKQLSE